MTEDEAKRRRKGRYAEYPLAEKLALLSEPIPIAGCIVWTGALNDSGYGRMKIHSKFRRAHIVAWEIQNGPVAAGLCIDHLCRVRCCINPAHMELVTPSENVRRANRARHAL